jgi:hypothetical protein
VKDADGIPLELLALGLVALDIRQTGDPVLLQAPMRRENDPPDRFLILLTL